MKNWPFSTKRFLSVLFLFDLCSHEDLSFCRLQQFIYHIHSLDIPVLILYTSGSILQPIAGPSTLICDQHNVNQLWHPRLLRFHLCLSRFLPRLLCIWTEPRLPNPNSISPRVATLSGNILLLLRRISRYPQINWRLLIFVSKGEKGKTRGSHEDIAKAERFFLSGSWRGGGFNT